MILRAALIVLTITGVCLASGAAIPAVLGLKAMPAQNKTYPTPATAICPAYQTECVEQMRDQETYADLLRATLIVWPAIGVVKVHPFFSFALLIFLLLFLCFV